MSHSAGTTENFQGSSNKVTPFFARLYAVMSPYMNEKSRRLMVGAEAYFRGHGGVNAVAWETGVNRATVSRGRQEIAGQIKIADKIRHSGGGRKDTWETDPTFLDDLKRLVDPETRADPMSQLRWCSKSTEKLAVAMRKLGHKCTPRLVAKGLRKLGYSLQALAKTFEGRTHVDRDAQFAYINTQMNAHISAGQPVLSVDTKKKELVGLFQNGGREYQKKACPIPVNAYDFPNLAEYKAAPYGIYDLVKNKGFVNVGVSHNTPEFAAASIRAWLETSGKKDYPNATKLLIVADGGGSNGSRPRAWKVEIAKLARDTGLVITVCPFSPGTSKWNKIEHKMFSFISMNWRGRVLGSLEEMVNLISSTTTTAGLTIQAVLDTKAYPTGVRYSKAVVEALTMRRHDFHGEWNYTFYPEAVPTSSA